MQDPSAQRSMEGREMSAERGAGDRGRSRVAEVLSPTGRRPPPSAADLTCRQLRPNRHTPEISHSQPPSSSSPPVVQVVEPLLLIVPCIVTRSAHEERLGLLPRTCLAATHGTVTDRNKVVLAAWGKSWGIVTHNGAQHALKKGMKWMTTTWENPNPTNLYLRVRISLPHSAWACTAATAACIALESGIITPVHSPAQAPRRAPANQGFHGPRLAPPEHSHSHFPGPQTPPRQTHRVHPHP